MTKLEIQLLKEICLIINKAREANPRQKPKENAEVVEEVEVETSKKNKKRYKK